MQLVVGLLPQVNTTQFMCSITVGNLGGQSTREAKLVPSSQYFDRVLRRMEREMVADDSQQELSVEMIVAKLQPQAKLWMM